jgi:hypothetical protein
MLHSLLTARLAAQRLGRPFTIGEHSRAVARLLELTDNRSLLSAER